MWSVQKVFNRFLQELDKRLIDMQKESKSRRSISEHLLHLFPLLILQSGLFQLTGYSYCGTVETIMVDIFPSMQIILIWNLWTN